MLLLISCRFNWVGKPIPIITTNEMIVVSIFNKVTLLIKRTMPLTIPDGHFLPLCPESVSNRGPKQHITSEELSAFTIILLANEIRYLRAKVIRLQAQGCKANSNISLADLPASVPQKEMLNRYNLSRKGLKAIMGRFADNGHFKRKSGTGKAIPVMSNEVKEIAPGYIKRKKEI